MELPSTFELEELVWNFKDINEWQTKFENLLLYTDPNQFTEYENKQNERALFIT